MSAPPPHSGRSLRRGGAVAALAVGLGAAAPADRTLEVGVDAPTAEATLALAREGDTVLVPPGTWTGRLTVDRAITLRGTGGTLDGGGRGSVLTITAPGAVVEGLQIRRSGDSLAKSDACIYVTKEATAARLLGNELVECAFGIWVHETAEVELSGNRVTGTEQGHRSNRGNGINLFNASALRVVNNTVTGGRDGIYVSATEDSHIEGNLTERTRYGIHYMFSYRNVVRNNVARNNASGYAIMGSLHIRVTGNRAIDNDEHGILFRDVQYSQIEDNTVEGNGHGLFFYSSTENVIKDNTIRGNDVGAKIWAGSVRNAVSGNRFVGNDRQIFYVGTKDLIWGEDLVGNVWSDYLGWDHDGDGVGDRPYRVDSFTTNLIHRYPTAVLLLRSPSLELLAHLERKMPILTVPTVIDRQPLVRRRIP